MAMQFMHLLDNGSFTDYYMFVIAHEKLFAYCFWSVKHAMD